MTENAFQELQVQITQSEWSSEKLTHLSILGEPPGANAMKHSQARFTKFCKTSQFLNSILAAIVVKFSLLEGVIALKCSVLYLTNIKYLN